MYRGTERVSYANVESPSLVASGTTTHQQGMMVVVVVVVVVGRGR
jgi:hypothetical protein